MDTKMMSTIDIGKLIGVHPGTVVRWIEKNGLKSYKTVGGHNRVRFDDLLEYVREHDLPFPRDLLQVEKTKVLIVDNDESVLNVLAESLSRSEDEFTVETATDGFQAGQIMERLHPDVVVLDIFLPGLDGFQVCKMMKDGHPDIRIIAITGHGDPDVKKMILKAGADEYIEKPFNLEELAERVGELPGNT
jgi:excisionase family DNA binding protein